MPGFTTHYLFGTQMIRYIKKDNKTQSALLKSIAWHKTAFQLGLQGPDFFFYYLPSQLKKEKPGTILHTERTAAFLNCLFRGDTLFKDKSSQEIARAYAAGFLGHYILDTQMHPYVYYMSGYKNTSCEDTYGTHIALETDIDNCLLMRYTGYLPSAFHAGKTIAFGRYTRSVIACVLAYAFKQTFPELHMTKRRLSCAILSMQTVIPLLHNPHGWKRTAAELIERLLFHQLKLSAIIPYDNLKYSDDPLNLTHRPWHNPWKTEEQFCFSVPEQIKKASGRYRKAFSELEQLYDTTETNAYKKQLVHVCNMLGNLSYHSGLPLYEDESC